jgi:hypothetical protein
VSEERAVATLTAPLQGPIKRIRWRLHEATRAARDAQAESERRLWHEYRTGGRSQYGPD